MAKAKRPQVSRELDRLRAVLDARAGLYKSLRDADDLRAYLAIKGDRADEELLTEPILASIIEQVLGFPTDTYFPQLGKGGLKPDFTPVDLIAHRFVLDAKASDEDLGKHEKQIRYYVDQRALDFGVLFNLREVRVYRRREKGHVAELSFPLLPLWEAARGEAISMPPELARYERFRELFSYREMDLAAKIVHIREQLPWSQQPIEDVRVDIEFLVDRLRALSRELVEDARAQTDRLEAFLRLNPARERKLLEELRLLALDLAPGSDPEELPATVAGWRTAEGVAARAWRQYLLRAAYLALARILLYRSWEDVEFVDQYLYDGGFGIAYDRLSQNVRDVLRDAFQHGAEQYHWLYGPDNNYDWFRPREEALIDVLYSLAPVPLGKLDADVLGGLYVSYVEEIDRDRLGQFFTPRSVVKFMLDRAGFTGPEGVFRIEGDKREPRRILDFATGSGGFLVEAARRIIDEGGIGQGDIRGLEEALAAIATGFVGGEISPFPYYLTEVNLLLQVSRLLGELSLAGESPPRFVLGVLHVDTLTAKSDPDASIEGMGAEHRADRGELVQDERFDLVPLDGQKLETYRSVLRKDEVFDLVVGNPPYVSEANNKPLFDRLRAIPGWKDIYRGKTDYLYYFLWLAVEKLAPGGKLCVITPTGWMNAGSAGFLREKLASELRLDEVFLFGSHRLFAAEQGPAPTPTVESAILVATKTPAGAGHKLRVVVLEDETAAAQHLSRHPEARSPERVALLDELNKRVQGKGGRKHGIHVHDVAQSDLVSERTWPLKFGAEDIAPRVVAHLDERLTSEAPVERLGATWTTFMGIETGADAYTPRIRKRLPVETRAALEARGVRPGDPILQLPPGREDRSPWKDHPELLAKAPEATGILYGAVDSNDYVNYVRIEREEVPATSVLDELDMWRPVLATRAEIARNQRRKWWETAWPRDAEHLSRPKVIGVHRTDRGRFALDEEGVWKPGKSAVVVINGADRRPAVAYLCGVLNSELIDLWYSVRGRRPRDVWRDYEPKPMNEVPYRRPEGDPRAEEVAGLVRELAANRRALLPHRAVVPELARVVKDPWKTGPVELDRAALVGELPVSETISVRLEPALDLVGGQGSLGKPAVVDAQTLVFRRARVETAKVTGDPARIALLAQIAAEQKLDDLGGVLLPRDPEVFELSARDRAELVVNVLVEGRELVERIERLVCGLYEVPPDLTDEVIAHAVQRAGGSEPSD